MNTDRLRLDLTDLAEQVAPVDLRDRALRSSRRLGIQRALVTSAAALALLGAATGTAFGLLPDKEGAPLPPAATATAPTPTSEPTPSTSSTPTPGPDGASSTAPDRSSAVNSARVTGTIFYGPEVGGVSRLHSWTPGAQPRGLAALDLSAALTNAMVSPDGRQVSWVTEQGSLYVSAVNGSGRRKLLDSVDNLCWGPTWSPDSRQLTIRTAASSGEPEGGGFVDVSSGRYVRSAGLSSAEGCHPLWSADGNRLAMTGGEGQVFVMNIDGSARRAIPGLGGSERWDCFDVASLSPDGGRIALYRRSPDQPSGDVARGLGVNMVLDTRTGRTVALPLGGRKLLQAVFRADGSMIVRVRGDGGNVLLLIGVDGRKLGESSEPMSLARQQILHATR